MKFRLVNESLYEGYNNWNMEDKVVSLDDDQLKEFCENVGIISEKELEFSYGSRDYSDGEYEKHYQGMVTPDFTIDGVEGEVDNRVVKITVFVDMSEDDMEYNEKYSFDFEIDPDWTLSETEDELCAELEDAATKII